MEQQYNQKHGAKQRNFNINDKVYVQLHKNNNWRWEEGIVKKKIGSVNYIISLKHRDIQAHTNQLKQRINDQSDKIPEAIPTSTLLDLFEQENSQSIINNPDLQATNRPYSNRPYW